MFLILFIPFCNIKAEASVDEFKQPIYMAEAGEHRSFIVKSDKSMWACGQAPRGNGKKGNAAKYEKIMDDVLQVAAGNTHFGVLKTDYSVWVWGDNSGYKLGDGTKTTRTTPVKIMDDVIMIDATSTGFLMVKKDGTLWATGLDLGDYEWRRRFQTPTLITDNVARIDAGDYMYMVLKNDGTVWVSGINTEGQIGNGKTDSDKYPLTYVMDNAVKISAGDDHCLAIKSDGSLWGWGDRANYTFGYPREYERINGNLIEVNKERFWSPQKIMDGVKNVFGGWESTFVIKNDNSLWATGKGILSGGFHFKEEFSYITDNVREVSRGYEHFLVVKNDGGLWASGPGSSGQIGDGKREYTYNLEYIMPLSSLLVSGRNEVIVGEDVELIATYYDDYGIAHDAYDTTWSTYFTDKLILDPHMNTVSVQTVKSGNVIIDAYHHSSNHRAEFELKVKPITVKLNGNKLVFDSEPLSKNGRVMVPMRSVFEALGFEVNWDASTGTATASSALCKIKVQVDNNNIIYERNGKKGTLTNDVAPLQLSGRILVPVRAISECAGCKVQWDSENCTVLIESVPIYKTVACEIESDKLIEEKQLNIVEWDPMAGFLTAMGYDSFNAEDIEHKSVEGTHTKGGEQNAKDASALNGGYQFLYSFVMNSVKVTTLKAQIGSDNSVSLQYGSPIEFAHSGKKVEYSTLLTQQYYNYDRNIVFEANKKADENIRKIFGLDGSGTYSMTLEFGKIASGECGYYIMISDGKVSIVPKLHPDTKLKIYYKEKGKKAEFVMDVADVLRKSSLELSKEAQTEILEHLAENGFNF